MNKVIFSGRMTKECELRQTTTGKLVTDFTLAVDRPYLNSEGKRDTDFFRVNAWGSAAKALANNGYKGCKLLVEGFIQNREYEAKDGTKQTITEVVLRSFEFNSPKKNRENKPDVDEEPNEQPLDEAIEEPDNAVTGE